MTRKKKEFQLTSVTAKKPQLLDRISMKSGLIFSGLLIAITLIIFYKPYVINQLEPMGADKIGAIGKTHQIREYTAETGERTLWNPNIFCGVPIYYRHSAKLLHFDTIIRSLQPVLDWKVGWFIIAGIALFILVLNLGFQWYFALMATTAFLFWPYFQSLILVGHDSKFMAIMGIPFVLLGFLNYIRRVSLPSLCLFALAFSLQIRTQHYQIIFYTCLLILFIGIWKITQLIKEKRFGFIFKILSIFLIGLFISILMVAQPLFIVNEYTPHSTRGGNAINLLENEKSMEQSGGVTFEYATRWSLAPSELMALISPRFYGGTSQEYYTGDKVPQLKNRKIPGYWGKMPFTQSSEYLGIVIIIFALAGIWFNRKDSFVITLSIFLAFSLLLAFGRHFPPLYKLFFYYLPYFSKFRAPMMILTMVQFLLVILSLYGINELLKEFNLLKYKTILIISGFFFLIGLIPVLNPGMLAYTSAADSQYASNPQVLNMLKAARQDMMVQDTIRMLFIIAVLISSITLLYIKRINRDLFIIGIILLASIDMISISYRFMKQANLIHIERIEQQYFRPTKTDQILSEDTEHHRILALGNLFQSNDLAYRYQIIGGYSAIKPQLIQDIIDNNLYTNIPTDPINWNVVNMLNGKYILSPVQLQYSGLGVLNVDENKRTILYRNDNSLNRVYFIQSIITLDSEREIVEYLNRPDFDPSKVALITENINQRRYSIASTATITSYTPNQIDLAVSCQDSAFMVLADTYYPIGWKAYIDENATHIYQTNHVLRGIIIPPGDHSVSFKFAPQSYYRSKWLSILFTYLTWTVLLGSLLFQKCEFFNKQIKRIRKNAKLDDHSDD